MMNTSATELWSTCSLSRIYAHPRNGFAMFRAAFKSIVMIMQCQMPHPHETRMSLATTTIIIVYPPPRVLYS